MNPTQEIVREAPLGLHQILIMEDELSVAKGLEMVLAEEGYKVEVAMNGKSALDTLNQKGFDLLVADLRLPDIDGMEVIKQVKQKRPETGVVVITGYSTVASAVDAMKLGVYDYLPKPFTDDEFKTVVTAALAEQKVPVSRNFIEKIDTEEGNLIQKQEVLRVLNRASRDQNFWRDLLENGSAALKDFKLSNRAKAAILSGDLNWIRKHVGDLSEKQMEWILSRLEMERW